MTKTEAIDLLDNLIGFVEDNQNNDYDKALKMAIEALSCSEKPNRSDVISRQDAIYYVKQATIGETDVMKAWVKAQTHLMRLPSAQPERKKGEWEIYVISMLDGEGCRCSECGFEGVPYWDFCPDCGADMRGEEDESNRCGCAV